MKMAFTYLYAKLQFQCEHNPANTLSHTIPAGPFTLGFQGDAWVQLMSLRTAFRHLSLIFRFVCKSNIENFVKF